LLPRFEEYRQLTKSITSDLLTNVSALAKNHRNTAVFLRCMAVEGYGQDSSGFDTGPLWS
jgi:hypothetical protein